MEGFLPYLSIGDHGLVGDRRTAALVARDGTIDWLCLPDYADDPILGTLLDASLGGWCRCGPRQVALGAQRYHEDTAILKTSWAAEGGELELTDAMLWPEDDRKPGDAERRVVLRRLQCLAGNAECTIGLAPRDLFVPDLECEATEGGWEVHFFGRCRLRFLGVWSSRPLAPKQGRHPTALSAEFTLHAGETAWMILARDEPPSRWSERKADDALEETIGYWRQWMRPYAARRPACAGAVLRSILTTHLLGYAPSGSVVAAPTMGLPERIGGPRNYDYRYTWIRDASLSLASLSMVGGEAEADRYLAWLSRLASSVDAPLQVAYGVNGETRIRDCSVPKARGFRDSKPVRIGNRAYAQRQIGSLGYVADCMATALRHGAKWRPEYSGLLRRIASYACSAWREADSGIWELKVRQQFVASKAMAWVVLDRAVKIANALGGFDLPEVERWRIAADEVRASILADGYSNRLGAFRQRYGHEGLDAAALLVPVMDLLPADDPRVTSTLDRIEATLGLGSFLYRFQPNEIEGETPLPVGQFEGTFLPCSFWMATARAKAGQIGRAEQILDNAEHVAGGPGLFAEEVDPRTGEQLGNYPLAFSHVEHIRAAVAIEDAKTTYRRAGSK